MMLSGRQFVRSAILAVALSALAMGLTRANAETFSDYRDAVLFVETELQNSDGSGKKFLKGTGFIVSPTGYVITAAHVVPKPSPDQQVRYSAAIRSKHNPKHPLEIINWHGDIDVALARLPDLGVRLRHVKFIMPGNNILDARLYTLGFPGQADQSSAEGLLSSTFGVRGYWQTTLPLTYGNSGGPVFDERGFVVGVAVGGIDDVRQRTFVVPINYLIGLLGIVPVFPERGPAIPSVHTSIPPPPPAATMPVPEKRTYWNHNGSVMYLRVQGNDREFYYHEPRPGMLKEGARPNTLLFKGRAIGNQYEGSAFLFSAECGVRTYQVSGPIENNGSRVVMTGEATVVNEECRPVRKISDTLVFDYLYTK